MISSVQTSKDIIITIRRYLCFSAIAMILPGFHSAVVLISLLCLLNIRPGTAGNSEYYHKLWWKHHNKCPMGATKASRLETLLGTLFPGLFVGLAELKAVVDNVKLAADISNATSILEIPQPDPLTTTTMEPVTHVVSTQGPTTQEPASDPGGPRANFGCCEM